MGPRVDIPEASFSQEESGTYYAPGTVSGTWDSSVKEKYR